MNVPICMLYSPTVQHPASVCSRLMYVSQNHLYTFTFTSRVIDSISTVLVVAIIVVMCDVTLILC